MRDHMAGDRGRNREVNFLAKVKSKMLSVGNAIRKDMLRASAKKILERRMRSLLLQQSLLKKVL